MTDLRGVLALFACILAGCAARQDTRASDSLFASPEAELARQHAPDLYAEAELASNEAEEARRRKDDRAAEDLRTEARLWLAAAVAESERIQLERYREELEREEERWAKQLARDQEASAVVAADIARYRAKKIALEEAERISETSATAPVTGPTLDALTTRVQLNLALAKALGASDDQVGPLRDRTEAMTTRGTASAQRAEALLLQSEALLGQMRAKWPAPTPGASTELVELATALGFRADQTALGVLVRSERFFEPSGSVARSPLNGLRTLVEGFPHGPVGCQVAVPNESRAWERRVAQLAESFDRLDARGRISTSMVVTQSLTAGTVQCAFAVYRQP